MTDQELKELSEAEINQIYNQRVQQLQRDFIQIKKNLKSNRTLKPHQQAMYDFVVHSKSSISFEINEYTIIVYKGDKGHGFKHILLRHYCSGCDGEITSKDILNIGNVIANDIELPGKKGRKNFIQYKNEKKYTVVLKVKQDGRLIFNFFSS
jgi:hypothetical protein